MALKRPQALILSSLSLGTGSGLRASYLCKALEHLGWQAQLCAPGSKARAYGLEMLGSWPRTLASAWKPRDLVVIVKPFPNAWSSMALARWRGALTVVDVDDDDGAYRGGVVGALVRALQAPAWSLGHCFSSHHAGLREGLARRVGAARVLPLPQGVDLGVFKPQAPEALSGPTRLAHTAHLNVACQLEALLSALGPWLRSHPEACLTVAGGGPSEGYFRALAAPLGEQVRFLGPVSNHEAAQVLARAHCSLSAYGANAGNQYRVPMKVAESLAVGTPVVCNRIPGLQSLGPYLYAADSLEPAAFGRALDQALISEDGRTKAGQQHVIESLDWDKVAARFLADLRSLHPSLAIGSLEPVL